MVTAVWAAFAVGGAASIGGIAAAASRGWRMWRTFRALVRALGRALGDLERRSRETEEHVRAAGDASARLSEALARLEHSRAELAVLQAASDDARGSVRRVRSFVPRK